MADDKETDSAQPPAKLPRLSGADTSAGKYVRALRSGRGSLEELITVASFAGEVTMAASSPLVLGLGLGLGAGVGERDAEASAATAAPKRASALTFMQQQELEHQVLIYRFFAAGAPVPVHLVLPIWKSVAASSFGPQRFPSLMGLGSLCFDYRSSMEPEPGRCRRTDGKKWRCSRDVVPGHKYCERHVHRGRGRSRKPVEAASAAAPTTTAAAVSSSRGGAPVHHHGGAGAAPHGLGFSPTSVLLAHSAARAT
ncbi:growth-regulating factor 10-like [Panicum miliaceum]|uniref:Growth-regulating factor n=1 Tax=Panicum miliaceum TaxID=4540 RepID=A0A3L6QJU1_PANMI|nr:growth-regulating factor 10-like [Panicum miliaceum]